MLRGCRSKALSWGAAFGWILLVALSPTLQAADPPSHVQASLIAARLEDTPGKTIWVGIHMLHTPGWHTYWKNPGDAGMPTEIAWHLPVGWRADEIDWPAPVRIAQGPLASYGYEGELVLPVMLTAPQGWTPATPVQVAATVSWLACRESCIPEKAQLSIQIPTQSSPGDQALMETFLRRTPEAFDFAMARAVRRGDELILTLEPAGPGEFFPSKEELIEPGNPPRTAIHGYAIEWSSTLGDSGKKLPAGAPISGIWVEAGRRPRRVETTLSGS
ncbi:MAG: protein-disulfide reductase DsbD domain-containing protein [Burkholderiaceae bacterium]|jgi:thiol:disulfide interchange protein DsbD